MIHNKFIKWTIDTEGDFCDTLIDFRDQHRDIFRVTNVAKYRSFQYRLLQRGLVTNILLEKWGIVSSSMCSFCRKMPKLCAICSGTVHKYKNYGHKLLSTLSRNMELELNDSQ